jgi:hypothetical protein
MLYVSVLQCWQLNENSPDKATEFSGHGSDGDVTVFALLQTPEFFVETVLGFQGMATMAGG